MRITVVTKMFGANFSECFLCTLNAIFGKLLTELIAWICIFRNHRISQFYSPHIYKRLTVACSGLLRLQEVGKLKN